MTDLNADALEAAAKARERGRAPLSEVERLREALAWIAEYGERNGDLRAGHLQAVKHIARNTLGLDPSPLPTTAGDNSSTPEPGSAGPSALSTPAAGLPETRNE